MSDYEVTLSKHPEIGFGTWWEVREVDPPHLLNSCWSGYALTWGSARRSATRLVRRLQRDGKVEKYVIGGAA